MAQMTPMKLTRLTTMPAPVMMPDGLVGQAGDAVKGQRQHLAQGVVALAGQTLVALVGDARRWGKPTSGTMPRRKMLTSL